MDKIYIEFGDSVYLNSNESMFIYCDTELWSNRLKSLMQELLPQIYNEYLKAYEASKNDFDYLIRRCKEMNIAYEINENKDIDNDAPKTDNTIKTFEYKTKPYSHQVTAVDFGCNLDRFLLADQMGCGKTKEVIDIAVKKKIERDYKHCLIVCCVNGLKWNWEDEVSIHSDEKAFILGNRLNRNNKWVVKGSKSKIEDINKIKNNEFKDTYFIITNIESLRDKDISSGLKDLCENNIINMIAVDEMHKCSTPSSQQSKGLLKLNAESMIAMTGSPIMNNPLDLYMILNWLGYERHNFYQFRNHFCRFGAFKEITGFKNMEQIQDLLKVMMLRRLKSDVLDLPEKIYTNEYVEMSTSQSKIYNEVLNDLRDQVDLIRRAKNPLASLIRLRQATGHTSILSSTVSCSAKYDRCLELVKDYVNEGHKVIIFSNWKTMTDILKVGLTSYNPAVITGETVDRQSEKNRFMNNPDCKIILGTIGACGTGLTLTAADVVIFYDEPWTWGSYDQACDRAHRIGTKNNVQIINLITKNTIDEKINDIVMKKKLYSDTLIDNLSASEINKLLNFLLY